jgi:hypothetical protein
MKALVRLAGLPALEAKMPITVRELMQLPHLQMSLLAGHGGIDREVTWVHTSDLQAETSEDAGAA